MPAKAEQRARSFRALPAIQFLCLALGIACLAIPVSRAMGGWLARREAKIEWRQVRTESAAIAALPSRAHREPLQASQARKPPVEDAPSSATVTLPKTGQTVARLRIPRLKVNESVFYDASKKNLDKGPCWMTGSARPPLSAEDRPEAGLRVIQAHRDKHFRPLKTIRLGDWIELETAAGTQGYRVRDIEIMRAPREEERLAALRQKDALVLLTCYPFRYIGPAPDRYLVWAEPDADPRPGDVD